jgi:hypothetical protein
MPKMRPSNADRILGHIIVAAVVAFVGSKVKGVPGAITGAVIGVIAHEELDAPLAQVIAELG